MHQTANFKFKRKFHKTMNFNNNTIKTMEKAIKLSKSNLKKEHFYNLL